MPIHIEDQQIINKDTKISKANTIKYTPTVDDFNQILYAQLYESKLANSGLFIIFIVIFPLAGLLTNNFQTRHILIFITIYVFLNFLIKIISWIAKKTIPNKGNKLFNNLINKEMPTITISYNDINLTQSTTLNSNNITLNTTMEVLNEQY